MHPHARTIGKQLEIVNPQAPTYSGRANPSVFYKNCAELWGGDFTNRFYGSPNFFQTCERPQTIFGKSQIDATHLFVVWNPSDPSECRCCFLSTIDIKILKEAIGEKHLKNCYLCTCAGIPEVRHPEENPDQISTILAEMQWVAHFFSGDAAYLEENQQMTAELYVRMGMPAEEGSDARKVWLDNAIKFLALRAQNEQDVLRNINLSFVIQNGKQRDDTFAMQLAEAGLSPTATAEQIANILEKKESIISDDVLIRIIARCPSLFANSKVTGKVGKLVDRLLSQDNPNQEHLRILCEQPDASLLELTNGNITGLVAQFSDQRIGQIEDIKLAICVADARLHNLKCGALLVQLFDGKVSGKKITSGSIDHYSDGQILHLLETGKFSSLLASLSAGRIGRIENPDLVAKLDAAQCAHVDFAKFTEEQLVQLSGEQLKCFPTERCSKIKNKGLLLKMPKDLWEHIIKGRDDDQILELIAGNNGMLDSLSGDRIWEIGSFDLIRELKDDQFAHINWRNLTDDQLVQLPETKLKYILGKIDGIDENKNSLFILWKHNAGLRGCFSDVQFKIMVTALSDSDELEVYKQTPPELLVKLGKSLIRKILRAWDQKAIGGLNANQLKDLINASYIGYNEEEGLKLTQHIATSFGADFALEVDNDCVAQFLWIGNPNLQSSIDPLLVFKNIESVKETTAATAKFLEKTYGIETAALFGALVVDSILKSFTEVDDQNANSAVDKFLKTLEVGGGSSAILLEHPQIFLSEKLKIQGKNGEQEEYELRSMTTKFTQWLIRKIHPDKREGFALAISNNFRSLGSIELPFLLNNLWLLVELQKCKKNEQFNEFFTEKICKIINSRFFAKKTRDLKAIQDIVKDVSLPDEILAAFSKAISAQEKHKNYSELDGIKKAIEAQQNSRKAATTAKKTLPSAEQTPDPSTSPKQEGPPISHEPEETPGVTAQELTATQRIEPEGPPGNLSASPSILLESNLVSNQGPENPPILIEAGGASELNLPPTDQEGPLPGPDGRNSIPKTPTPGIRTSKQKVLFGFSILLFILAAGAVIIGAVCLLWPIIIGIGIYIIGSAALVFLIASIACYVSSRPSTANV
jgi:hypothetical protein